MSSLSLLSSVTPHNTAHLLDVHVEVVEAVLVDVVAGEGPHVLPLDPELLRRDVQPEEHVHGRHAWCRGTLDLAHYQYVAMSPTWLEVAADPAVVGPAGDGGRQQLLEGVVEPRTGDHQRGEDVVCLGALV